MSGPPQDPVVRPDAAVEGLPDGDFSLRIAAAIARRGLGLQRLSGRLRQEGISCSPSTLSLWSNARTMPRRAEARRAVQALEPILQVPPGYLVEAMDRAPRPDPADGGGSARAADEVDRLFLRAREELGFTTDPSRTTRLLIHETVRLDEQGRFIGLAVRQVLRAERRGAERVLAGAFADPRAGGRGDGGSLRQVRVGVGGRLGRVREFPDAGVTVVEIVLERPLAEGELTVLEYVVRPGAGPEPRVPGWNFHVVSSLVPVEQLVAEVEFSASARPPQIHGTVHHDRLGHEAGPPDASWDEIALQGDTALVAARDLRAGGVEIAWRWEPA